MSGKKSVCHAAAHNERVDLVKQICDDAYLVGNLCPAENCRKGTLGIFERAAYKLNFLFDKITADSGKVVGDARRGAVRPVSRTERVVDKYIGKRSKIF